MVLGVPARHALEHRLVVQPTVAFPQGAGDAIEGSGIVRDGGPDAIQLRPRRHPETAADETLAGLEMEVEASASFTRFAANFATRATVVEPAAGVRLVRRLVLGEADVAIDPEHRAPDVTADLGGDASEADVHLLDQLAHRLPNLVLVFLAVILEPGFAVVALELPEEAKGSTGERHTMKDAALWR